MRSLSFASADRSMGQATRLTAGYGYSSTHVVKELSVVTADPLTLSLLCVLRWAIVNTFTAERASICR